MKTLSLALFFIGFVNGNAFEDIGCLANPNMCLDGYCINDGGPLGTCVPSLLRDFSHRLLSLRDQLELKEDLRTFRSEDVYPVSHNQQRVNMAVLKKKFPDKTFSADVVRVVDAVREAFPIEKLTSEQREKLAFSLAELIVLQRKLRRLKKEQNLMKMLNMKTDIQNMRNENILPRHGNSFDEKKPLMDYQLENILIRLIQMEDKSSKQKQSQFIPTRNLSRRDEAVIRFVSEWFLAQENQSQDGDKEHENNFGSENSTIAYTHSQELVEVQKVSDDQNENVITIEKLQNSKRLTKLTGTAVEYETGINLFKDASIAKISDSNIDLAPNVEKVQNLADEFMHKAAYTSTALYIAIIVLIGLLLLVIIAVLVWSVCKYIKKQHLQKELMGNDNSSLSDENYQELCRQRFATKYAEKTISARENNGKDSFQTKVHQTLKNNFQNSPVSSTVSTPAYVPPYMHNSLTRNSSIASLSWSEEPVNATLDISTGHAVLTYMEDHLQNQERLDEEWSGMCAYEAEDVTTVMAVAPNNVRKNRFPDALPFDQNRVKLNRDCNHLGSDYINASEIIDNDPKNPLYIATQGPLASTIPDFWQMIWEKGCAAIVMLAPLVEESVPQCARYWPDEGSCSYDRYEIHLVSEHIWCEDYLVRSLYLKNTSKGETRTVTQFHFLSWPNEGIPQNTKPLLELRR